MTGRYEAFGPEAEFEPGSRDPPLVGDLVLALAPHRPA